MSESTSEMLIYDRIVFMGGITVIASAKKFRIHGDRANRAFDSLADAEQALGLRPILLQDSSGVLTDALLNLRTGALLGLTITDIANYSTGCGSMSLAGWQPMVVAALLGFNLIYQFLLHTETVGRLGPLEWVLNTPAHHRVHHASNPYYIDKNFGGVLIVFDRWFGTFASERPDDPCRYGLTTPVRSRNPVKLACNEGCALARDVSNAGSFKEALRRAWQLPYHQGEEGA